MMDSFFSGPPIVAPAIQPPVKADLTKPPEESKGITINDWDQLAQEIRKILAVSFICESSELRAGRPSLPIDECMAVYKKNPFVFFYINKQTTAVMKAFRESLEKTAGVKVTG